jgi:hypothetical protein
MAAVRRVIPGDTNLSGSRRIFWKYDVPTDKSAYLDEQLQLNIIEHTYKTYFGSFKNVCIETFEGER